MFYFRAEQGALRSTNRQSAAGSDLRAGVRTPQSDVADLVRRLGMSAAESRQFV